MQGNEENWQNSFWWSVNRETNVGKMTKRRSLEIQKFSQENVEIFGGPRTETKFVKWFASRKRLRTAGIR